MMREEHAVSFYGSSNDRFCTDRQRARQTPGAIDPTLDAGGLHGVWAAHQSTAIIATGHWVKLDAVTGHAVSALELVAGDLAANRILALTHSAIRSWRRLAGVANPSQAFPRHSAQVGRSAAGLPMYVELLPRMHRRPRRHRDRSTPSPQQRAWGTTNSSTPDQHAGSADKHRLSRLQRSVLDTARPGGGA